MAYDLGPVVPDGIDRHVPAGTSLLVVGPTGVDCREFASELLAAGQRRGGGVVLVSTDVPGPAAWSVYRQVTGEDASDDRLFVINATGTGGERVVSVPSPGALTELGTALTRGFDAVGGSGDTRVGVLSLTGMLEHLDRGATFKFCTTLSRQVDDGGMLGVATLNPDACNEQTLAMLTDAFDGLVELEERASEVVCRVTGLDAPNRWLPV